VVTTLKNSSVTKWTWSGARFVRESPSEKQLVAPKFILVIYRARYYDPSTGEFASRDPLEYVDGMSLYRGYFGLGAVDPSGTDIDESYCPEKVVGHPWKYGEVEDGALGETKYSIDFQCKCTPGTTTHTHFVGEGCNAKMVKHS
jgi:RHS repeat-associated protein